MVANRGRKTAKAVNALIRAMIAMAITKNRKLATSRSTSIIGMTACLTSPRNRLTASPGDAGRELPPLSRRT